MSKESDSSTEQQEDVVDLFAEGFKESDVIVDEAVDETVAAPEANEDTTVEGDNIPEKYRDKSISEVVAMHQNLEKAYGRHNNELGELRQLTDQILKQQLGETKPAAEAEAVDSDALLENPTDVINTAVENNPKMAALEAKLAARERADDLAVFNRTHPNSTELINDARFLAWVQESPTRTRLFQQADQNYDYALAGEIMDTYNSLHPAEEANETRDETKRGMSNARPSTNGNGGKGKKQVFKRSDLMRLRNEDPDRYERLQPQILKAYQEGRVR
jgi:hypothetical protein